jgi:hypothetical protein
MQILQILEYWLVIVALSPALRHELQYELMQLAPIILVMGTPIVAGAVVLAAEIGPAAFLPMFLFALFPFLFHLEGADYDPNGATLQYGEMSATWKHSLAWGCLMAGVSLTMIGAIGPAKS